MRLAILCLGSLLAAPMLAQTAPPSSNSGIARSAQTDESKTIQQIEDELSDENANPVTYDRVLADDYVNLVPRGVGPGKAEIIAGIRRHPPDQGLPYTTEIENMHVYILGDTAVAAFTKRYTAKENGNVAHEDTTHIFQKDHGAWRLKISRATLRGSEEE